MYTGNGRENDSSQRRTAGDTSTRIDVQESHRNITRTFKHVARINGVDRNGN